MSAKRRVSEPVQVYLDAVERQRLERLAQHLGATKSDVLRRGLEVLERQASDPDAHPALQIIGLADRERAGGPAYDGARELGAGAGSPAAAAPWPLRSSSIRARGIRWPCVAIRRTALWVGRCASA